MNTTIRYIILLYFLVLLPFFGLSQKAYFELSEYVDNGTPGASIFNSFNSQEDAQLNRIYHYGRLSSSFSSQVGTPQNFLTTNNSNQNLTPTNCIGFLMITDTLGSLIYSTVVDFGVGSQLEIQLLSRNGDIFLYGNTTANDLITTNGSTAGTNRSGFIIKISNNTILTNGTQPDYATYIGSTGYTYIKYLAYDGNTVWAFAQTTDYALPITQSTVPTTGISPYLIGIDDGMISNNSPISNTSFARYIGNTSFGSQTRGMVEGNGNLYLLIRSGTNPFSPITDNSFATSQTVLMKFSSQTLANNLPFTAANGNYSSYLPLTLESPEFGKSLLIHENNMIYTCGTGTSNSPPLTCFGYPYLASNLTVLAISDASMNSNSGLNTANGDYLSQTGVSLGFVNKCLMDVYGGDLYIYSSRSTTVNNSIPSLTDNSTDYSNNTVYIQKIDSLTLANNTPINTTGDDWVQYFGTKGTDTPKELKVNANGVHLGLLIFSGFNVNSLSLPITNNLITVQPESGKQYSAYLQLCLNGFVNYITFLSKDDFSLNSIGLTETSTFFTGKVRGETGTGGFAEPVHPVTINSPAWSTEEHEFTFQKITSDIDIVVEDSLFPNSQTVCKFSTPETLNGTAAAFPNDSLPEIFMGGTSYNQSINFGNLSYQWQVANSPAGPWSDISGANLQSYLPTVTTFDKYYRRKSYANNCGSTTLVSISTVAEILVNTLTAPSVDAGGVLHTCPNVSLNLGGSPTAVGGLSPYNYTWDVGVPQTSNPLFTSAQNSVISLTVIDDNGCIKKDQVTVLVHAADAGNDLSTCDGEPIMIGTTVQGLPGTVFTWTPSTGLSCSDCPTPLASPSTPTEYALSQTIQISGGGTCTTYDTVQVGVVDAPPAGFAGQDQTICYEDYLLLGTSPQTGFSYTWLPDDGLNNPNVMNATFYPAQLYSNGFENPMQYILLAQMDNCTFQDTISIPYIYINAGPNLCDSGTVGTLDKTPLINEIYSWSVVSGPGTITGPTNTPQTTVSQSLSTPTIFQLDVTLNGVTCTDFVEVSECIPQGSGSSVSGGSSVGCPSYLLTQDSITLTASTTASNHVSYSWTPQMGLSAYTGQSVDLLTTQHITYTVYFTDTILNQVIDSATIEVNNPNWTIPDVEVVDTLICYGNSVELVENYNTAYNYSWGYIPGYTNGSGNPDISPSFSNDYPVTVIDPSSGCEAYDTAVVIVDNISINNPAGNDWSICSNGIVELGQPENANFTYSWDPPVAPWQNGTDEFSAQPSVMLSNSTQFVLTYASVLNSCVYTDTVDVFVGNQPTTPNLQDTTICAGSLIQIGEPAVNNIEYSWSPGASVFCSTCAQTYTQANATTTYTLTMSYVNSAACPDSSSTNITVNTSLSNINLTDFTYCYDGGTTSLAASNPPSGLTQYTWSPANLLVNPTVESPDANLVSGNYTLNLTVVDSLGCTANTSVNITPSTSAPEAGQDQSICLNSGTLTLGSITNPSTVTWSPSTYLSSSFGSQVQFTPSSPGVFPIVVTEVTGNCEQTDTVYITVHDLPEQAVFSTEMICNNTCIDIGPSNNPSYSYQWSPSTGLSSTNTSTTTACLSQSQQYSLIITDQNSCVQNQNYNIVVNNTPAPAISLPAIDACADDVNIPLNYSVNPSGGSFNYTWSPASIFSNMNSANPTIQNPGIGSYNITVEMIDQNSGCIGGASTMLTIEDCNLVDTCDQDIDINFNALEFCSNDTISFTLISDTIPTTYTWNYNGFSQSGFGTSASGDVSYNNIISEPDTVYFNISPDVGNCFVADVDTFVIVNPSPQPIFNNGLQYCSGDSVLVYTSDNFSSYNWDGNITSDSSHYFTVANNPIEIIITDANNCTHQTTLNVIEQSNQFYFDTLNICTSDSLLINGNYKFASGDYVDTSQTALCDSITYIHLIVHNPPTITNTFSTIDLCVGDSVHLDLNGGVNYFFDNNLINNDYTFSVDSDTTITIVGENAYSCMDSISIDILIHEVDSLSFNAPLIACESFQGDLVVNSTGILNNCNWNLNNSLNISGCNPNVDLNQAGCYDINFTATDGNGCLVDTTIVDHICIEEGPNAYFTFSPDPPTTTQNQVVFTEQSTNAVNFEWIIDGNYFSGPQADYTFSDLDEGEYDVCLIASSNLNCVDTICSILNIKHEFTLYVPNTFTPDGNNQNPEFLAQCSRDLAYFELYIYNRWGEVIFTSNDITQGWDGSYNGKICKDGTYTWKIKLAVGEKADDQYFYGHINLIR